MTAAFDEPLPEELPPDLCELAPLDDRADELRAREEEADDLRLDAPALFGLLREVDALLPELDALLPFDDVLRVLLRDALVFGLEPFELREVVFLLVCDRELAWAISPP